MQENDVQGLLAFGSEAEAVQWLLTAFHAQERRIIQLEKDLAEFNDLRASEIAQDRKRLAKLEDPHKPQDTHLLDELYAEMQAIGRKQVDFATAARMVKRSKSRMLQLKAEIGQDMRFILVPSESHSQKVLIRVRA